MNFTVEDLVTMQNRMFALKAVVEDIEASVSTALRELEMAQPSRMNPSEALKTDASKLSFALGITEQIEIYSRVFVEIESSVEQTLDISANIESDLKEMTE